MSASVGIGALTANGSRRLATELLGKRLFGLQIACFFCGDRTRLNPFVESIHIIAAKYNDESDLNHAIIAPEQ